MTRRIALALCLVALLPGCAGVVVADATKKESRRLIARVMAAERPDLDSAEAATCVQKAMTLVETAEMGLGDVSVVSPENDDRIKTYAARPEATACLAALPVTG